MEVAVEPVVSVTDAGVLQDRPLEGFAANDTVPAKVPIEVTVIVDEPKFVARILVGVTAPRVKVKLAPTETWTPAAPFTVLDKVEAEAAVPVTVTTKLAAGRELQVTDIRPALLTVAVQPVGWVDVTA